MAAALCLLAGCGSTAARAGAPASVTPGQSPAGPTSTGASTPAQLRPAATNVDLCARLTVATLDQLTGLHLRPGGRLGAACAWSGSDGLVSITQYTTGMDQVRAQLSTAIATHQAQPVAGVGQLAVVQERPMIAAAGGGVQLTLLVVFDTYGLEVDVTGQHPTATQAAAVASAMDAALRS